MLDAWLTAVIVGPLVALATGVVVLRVAARRRAVLVEREVSRLRRGLHAQLAENDREHARALLKAAEELFVLGHVETAAMLDLHATDFELRADDNAATGEDTHALPAGLGARELSA